MVQRPHLATLAVVLRQDKVLLVRRLNPPDAGYWGFPGGHVEWGEKVAQAAERELREETGVIGKARISLGESELIWHDEAGQVSHHFYLLGMMCDYISGEPVAADDATDAAWVAVSDVLAGQYQLSQDVDKLLLLALDYQDKNRTPNRSA